MSTQTNKLNLADLIKDSIEDIALTHAINAGLQTKPVVPTAEFQTNLISKRKLGFLQSFLDDFSRLKDGKTKAEIFKLVADLSSGKQIAEYRDITTKDILLNYARIKVQNSFVCLSKETGRTVLVRIISKKEITKYFLKAN